MYYSDFNYWEGTIFFDSIEDLLNKIITADYDKAHAEMDKHRVKNKKRNKENWQSIVRYLSDNVKPTIPKSFDEGMKLWENKMKPPVFYSKTVTTGVNKTLNKPNKWIIISESVIDQHINAQMDPECQVLYVANTKEAKLLHNLGQKIHGDRLKILTVEKQNSLGYRITQHLGLDNYSKGILTGSLYVLSLGATSIHIPHTNSQGIVYFQECIHFETISFIVLHSAIPK